MIIFTIFGLLFINRSVFYQLLFIASLDIILNVALKGTFKIPLSFPTAEGFYAFPSGHMQLATVFYGWLFIHFAKWSVRLFILGLLMSIAIAMMHFQYHDIYDVIAGVAVACFLLSLYQYLLLTNPHWVYYLLTGGVILMLYNHFAYREIPSYTWVAFLSLLALSLIEYIKKKRENILLH